MDGSQTHRVDSLSKLTKVEGLRLRIHEVFGVEPHRQRLFYRGKQVPAGGGIDSLGAAAARSPDTPARLRAPLQLWTECFNSFNFNCVEMRGFAAI